MKPTCGGHTIMIRAKLVGFENQLVNDTEDHPAEEAVNCRASIMTICKYRPTKILE